MVYSLLDAAFRQIDTAIQTAKQGYSIRLKHTLIQERWNMVFRKDGGNRVTGCCWKVGINYNHFRIENNTFFINTYLSKTNFFFRYIKFENEWWTNLCFASFFLWHANKELLLFSNKMLQQVVKMIAFAKGLKCWEKIFLNICFPNF